MYEFDSNADRESVLGQIDLGPLESHITKNLILTNPEACTGPSSVIIESQEVPIPGQALFIIKSPQVESIALPARQEAVVEVIVDGAHRSPILEENEEINSDSSKMDIEPSTVNQDDVLPEVAIQSVAQPEANIIVDLTDEVAAVDGVQHPKKVVADLEDEVKSLPIEAENPSEISEDLAKLTMKKEDSAIEEKDIGVSGEPDKPKEDFDKPESAPLVILEPGPAKKAVKGKSAPPKSGVGLKAKVASTATKPAASKPLTKPQRPPSSVATKPTPSTVAAPKPSARKPPAEPLLKSGPPSAAASSGRPATTIRSAPPATKRIPPVSTTPTTTRPASVAAGEKKDVFKKPLSARPASVAARPTVAEKAKSDVKKPVPAKRCAPPMKASAAPPAAQKPSLPTSTARPSSATTTAKNLLPKPTSTIPAKPLNPKGKLTPALNPHKSPKPNKALAATPSPPAARVASARASASGLSKTPSRVAPTSAGKKPLPSALGTKSSKKSDEATPASSSLHDSPPQVNGNPIAVDSNGMNGRHADNDENVDVVIDSQLEA